MFLKVYSQYILGINYFLIFIFYFTYFTYFKTLVLDNFGTKVKPEPKVDNFGTKVKPELKVDNFGSTTLVQKVDH